ncbi:hypothetical protein [Kribbella sp. NPDC023855]|uniref:hypothetical protein n=1 Tax=Kribbella sp. NPDC023855 TaxID=3154698 RepID=UPI003400150F
MTAQHLPQTLIWATRGHSWGFRFLLNGGHPDPLPEYERNFVGLETEPTTYRRTAGTVALRFPDPLGRKDAAGRIIPHDFVVSGDLADEIESVEDGRQQIWPRVARTYARVWEAEDPPSIADLDSPTHANSGDDERADPS